MKTIIFSLTFFLSNLLIAHAQTNPNLINHASMNTYETIKIESHIPGLKSALWHTRSQQVCAGVPVLFLHGSSFPSALSFGFKMGGSSWMDVLAAQGYDVYALDFLGYGSSDRYPEMQSESADGKPLGRASEVSQDVNKAVDYILKLTGKRKVHLIGHSWGGSVAALYAAQFPEKIEDLVLYAAITARHDSAGYENRTHTFELLTPQQRIDAMKHLSPANQICQLEREIFETWGQQWLASDPLAAASGSVRFPAGPLQDVYELTHGKPYFNPADIKVPTLIVRGEWDSYPNNTDAEKLFTGLINAPRKKYAVIEKGTHVMHLETSRFQLYDEVLHFYGPVQKRNATPKEGVAVIFEVQPHPDYKQEYLDIAASLRPELEKIPGFISIERFQSLTHPEKILSLSFWQNEEAISKWRGLESHRLAQAKGREYIFNGYRLRIGQIVRDYGMTERNDAPADSRLFHQNHPQKATAY